MTRVTTLASMAVVTLVLGSGTAGALEAIGGLNESIAPTPQDSIQDAVQTPSAEQSIQDAVQFDPIGDINDAVLDGANPGKGGSKGAVNGHETLVAFSCEASGNELLTLRNKGDMVPAGTKVRWEIRSLGERGAVRLKTALGQGDQVRVDIGMDIDAGTPCAAKAI